MPAHGAGGDARVHGRALGGDVGEARDRGEGLLADQELQQNQEEDDVHRSEDVADERLGASGAGEGRDGRRGVRG